MEHEYWTAPLNDSWPKNGGPYILFVSLNTLWRTQKVYSNLVRGTAVGTLKLLQWELPSGNYGRDSILDLMPFIHQNTFSLNAVYYE